MVHKNLKNVLFLATIFVATYFSQSPRLHVECRSFQRREVQPPTSTNYPNELTTQPTELPKDDESPVTTENSLTNERNSSFSISTEKPVEATTATSTTSDYSSFLTLSHDKNRSLYEELKSTSNFPSFSLESSSEFIKFENLKMESKSEESKSVESSLDEKFKNDEKSFKNNETKEERHSINEAVFDEESVKYSSIILNNDKDKDGEEEKTTAVPAVLTTSKKGKYLELVPQEDDNINASIPNAAEVWALAGMRDKGTSVEGLNKPDKKATDHSSRDVELTGQSLNNTVKNLLDWTEIARMDNETMNKPNDEKQKANDISGDDDPATSENKGVNVFVSSQPPTSTLKSIVDDNRIELESENGHLGNTNKTPISNSRIDSDILAKSQEEKEDGSVEFIDHFKKVDNENMKENLKIELLTTTENPVDFTTEIVETTTEIYDTTTSIVDSFTIIGEDEESDDIFKRTITELPPTTTEQSPLITSTTQVTYKTTTVTERNPIETTTEIPNFSINEIPESTLRYNKSTKSIRLATTTTEKPDTTVTDQDGFASTLIPKYVTTGQTFVPTKRYEFSVDTSSSSSSPTVEIFSDDKFKYGTILPETTTTFNIVETAAAGTSGHTENSTKNDDSLNTQSLDGEQTASSNLGIILGTTGVVLLIVVAAIGYFVFKQRSKQKFSQRCRPVGLDAYSLDNVSVYNSVRRKANALRLSKRSYGNSAFEDPSLQSNVLDYQSLQDFAKNKTSILKEFNDIPQVSVRAHEMQDNCEDKNRYANVVPLPETRVHLERLNDDEKTEYINANYVKGPKDTSNYYIATQAPLENTVPDFWRMVWEQNSKVIVMATDLTENGVERCAEYIPASVVLDNTQTYGDFQVTLKSREVKGKYAVSQLHLKNLKTNTWREIMHLWYSWPENGCPNDEASVISLLLEAKGYLRTNLPEQFDENSNTENNKDLNDKEKLSTLDKTKSLQRVQGPLTIHCSPGTGRTGTLIACDIILRMLEIPPRQIDIPQIVYAVRKGRANAIRTKDQYEFIYNIANAYAMKLDTTTAET